MLALSLVVVRRGLKLGCVYWAGGADVPAVHALSLERWGGSTRRALAALKAAVKGKGPSKNGGSG